MNQAATRSAAPLPTSRSRGQGSIAKPIKVDSGRARRAWFALLLAAICFEGLGRKYATDIPGTVFYFAKDVVLLGGLAAFGIRREIVWTASRLLRGFLPILPIAVGWTLLQMFNPDQSSVAFALLGFRAYWLWWVAPLVVGTVLLREKDRTRALTVMAVFAIIIAAFGLVQFSLPATHPLNRYAAADVESIAIVGSTGRTRVTSTFSYLTGFTDFTIIMPAFLLSIGLATASKWRRVVLFVGAILLALALPASGARAPLLLGLGGLAIVAYAAGLFWTREGRRVIAAGAAAIVAAQTLSATALEGIRSRFIDDPEETESRFVDGLAAIPPLAMVFGEYPALGLGTGTLQNAASLNGPAPRYVAEAEPHRVLIEQGIPGYLLLSLLRVGLVVALLRAGTLLRRASMRAEAGAAWALAAFTLPQNLIFDHIFQALYFIGFGIVLESVVRANASRRVPAALTQGVGPSRRRT